VLLFSRRYDEAIELERKGLEFEPTSAFTLAFQGVAYAEQGRFQEAVDNLQRAAALDDSLTILALEAHVLAAAGRKQQATRILRQVEGAAKHRYFCPYEIATVYVSLGDPDTAFRLFRKGTNEHAGLHGVARRRALAGSLPLGSTLREPPPRHRARPNPSVAPAR
jgi:tetratricopeptide (TPR) repeat protein